MTKRERTNKPTGGLLFKGGPPKPTKTTTGYSVRVRFDKDARQRLAYQARDDAEPDQRARELGETAALVAKDGLP